MSTLGPKSEPVRALVAVGAGGTAVVLATDSAWLGYDIDGISDGCDDLGIEAPRDRGLWLFEGTVKETGYHGPEGFEPGTEYDGRCRRPEDHELPALLAMTPPEDSPEPDETPCTHPDRGATVGVTCPKCKTAITLPADRPEWVTDRHCPVCNAEVPFLPEARP